MTTTTTTTLETLRVRAGAVFAARLPEHLERLHWNADRLAIHQRDRLRMLLRHAAEHSPFHAKRLGAIDPDRFELSDLPRLPTMTKSEMMAAFDDVVTDLRLKLSASRSPPGGIRQRAEPAARRVCLPRVGRQLRAAGSVRAAARRVRRVRRLDHAAGDGQAGFVRIAGRRYGDRRRHGGIAGPRQRLRRRHPVGAGALRTGSRDPADRRHG